MSNRPLHPTLLLPAAVAVLVARTPSSAPPRAASLSTADTSTPSSGSATPSDEAEQPQLGLEQHGPDFTDRYRAHLKCTEQRRQEGAPVEPFGSVQNNAAPPSTLSPDQRTKVERDCAVGTFHAR